MKNILVVCMGNICRSPTMEAVLKQKALRANLPLHIESAGTIGYHQGNPPDSRSRVAGEKRGYDFSAMTARQVTLQDFTDFDLILCADKQNLRDLQAICPAHLQAKLKLFLSYGTLGKTEVPDPYYGGAQGFEQVLDLVEEAADGLIAALR
ncbi:low molecular weight protein-tyrosine-phosphatase [Pseudoalteromonas fenneropenaei]|uniref:protein-tyrosine-phosphatase n=1 Tax=Pseudoalteromonas fenneropenaei TaxID=1737459 RepID=A0ABV7CJR4_9GAMM